MDFFLAGISKEKSLQIKKKKKENSIRNILNSLKLENGISSEGIGKEYESPLYLTLIRQDFFCIDVAFEKNTS